MPPATSTLSAELRRHFLERLHARYDARAKSAGLLFAGVQGFALLFLLLVLLPFASLRRQQRATEAQLRATREHARKLAAEADAYRRATSGLRALSDSMRKGPDELRVRILALADTPETSAGTAETARQLPEQSTAAQIRPNAPFRQQAPIQQRYARPYPGAQQRAGDPSEDVCGRFVTDSARAMCVVRAQLDEQYGRYVALLAAEVVVPLRALPPSARARPDSAMLDSALAELRASLERRFESAPRFWERFEGKVSFYDELRSDVGRSWDRFRFAERFAALDSARVAAESSRALLAARRERLEKREGELSARLASLESPLGKLPVGVIDGIQVFPILLTVGFVLWAMTAADVARLRAALVDGYRELDPEGREVWTNDLELVAPLELGPTTVGRHRPWSDALLLLPVAAFGIGCLIALYVWSVAPEEGQPPLADRALYAALYVLCAIALWWAARLLPRRAQ